VQQEDETDNTENPNHIKGLEKFMMTDSIIEGAGF
jgi:hypothetical protein